MALMRHASRRAIDILHLPSELIAHIFQYLDDYDLFNARVSHRALDKASFEHFARRFFRKKGFMITTRSLTVLQHIATHDELGKYLQHVWCNPDCYTFARPKCCPDDEEDSDLDSADGLETPLEKGPVLMARVHSTLSRQYAAYCDVIRDHSDLLYSDKLEERLNHAFRLLPNLRTVGMRRSEDYSPYGWTEIKDAVGEDPRILGPIPSTPSSTLSGPTQLFIALIGAISASGTRLERLYTDAIEVDNVPENTLTQEKLNAACSSILYIEANVIKGFLTTHPVPDTHEYNPRPGTAELGKGMAHLFKAMPNLKELGLQIFRDNQAQQTILAPGMSPPEGLRECYPYYAFDRLVNEVSFAGLTRIKLEKITAMAFQFKRFLEPCAPNLTSLKLRDIRLITPEGESRPWEAIFAFLRSSCRALEYVLFYRLMYERGAISYTEDPPAAITNPAYTYNHLPSPVNRALFTNYDQIAAEASGEQDVRKKLAEIEERHWYQRPLFTYAMDEDLWHTDTSDEEW
ncbi:hypothetical protein BST61_czeina21g000990 [Lecanosticta acicola]|uniref:F-box domain-containing protein n=1 Tax=Lecanosticta acicola TaxID=111012 RepID=A0AAI9EE90_9PEZI|nr:hypothetical protein BST61_czeina21g000990 [Lecanosticta acicola]